LKRVNKSTAIQQKTKVDIFESKNKREGRGKEKKVKPTERNGML
jgi:hypothetical protein